MDIEKVKNGEWSLTELYAGYDDPKFAADMALADALLLRPRVLLLDDFLAGLDRDMRESTGVLLSTVAAFSSVIVTGHELEDFSKWTTRFLVLRDGIVSATLETAGLSSEDLRERLTLALSGEG